MKMQNIANAIKYHFNYLKQEYGFRDVSDIIDNDYCSIKMQNNTTGISLNYERRENYLFAYLYRLVDGEIREDINPISSNLPLHSIELNYIIQFKDSVYFIDKLRKKSSKSIDELILDLAYDLKKYAKEVLNGDFHVFNEVDAVAKKRRLDWQQN